MPYNKELQNRTGLPKAFLFSLTELRGSSALGCRLGSDLLPISLVFLGPAASRAVLMGEHRNHKGPSHTTRASLNSLLISFPLTFYWLKQSNTKSSLRGWGIYTDLSNGRRCRATWQRLDTFQGGRELS